MGCILATKSAGGNLQSSFKSDTLLKARLTSWVAQIAQPALIKHEHLCRGRSHSLSRQPFPLCYCFYWCSFHPYTPLVFLLLQLVTFASSLLLCSSVEQLPLSSWAAVGNGSSQSVALACQEEMSDDSPWVQPIGRLPYSNILNENFHFQNNLYF